MSDTRAAAAVVLREAIASRTPAQRLAAAIQLSEDVRAIALAALRRRYPGDSVLSLVERMTGEPMRPMGRTGPLGRA